MFKDVIIKIGCYTIITILFTGCCNFPLPHENFKDHLMAALGRNIDEVPPYLWPHKEDLISSILLENGNIENRYQYIRTCIYIFEIDPKTRKIVGARFEGKETDCIVNP